MHRLAEAISTYFDRISSYDWWVVAVQLLMIGVVVHLVMRFLRGTRGAGLVKGAALLMAFMFIIIRILPGSGEWERIEFLYANFLVFALVAFLIAFQPEIRRALMSIGHARLFRGKPSELMGMIDELVSSSAHLSRNRTGAILAIERRVGLGGIIEGGTPLDSVVTSELINSIFTMGTPLHDMGIILRGGRLAAAGCQFPMAESESVDPSLGSRHRAALGLASDSDAIVLVVSEETGRISLAYEGQLHIGIEPSALRDLLIDLLKVQKMEVVS